MLSYKKYSLSVLLLIIISTLVRGFLAATIEFGNDEVYYRLYAMYPDWSHFDHPLMIGIIMQITSLNLLLDNEFFLRLGSVIIGAINIWIIFKIGLKIANPKTGYYAALLYVASIYASVITGVFILPDTPQSLFWLWSLYLIISTVPICPNLPMSGMNMLKIGAVLGLGILSKYTTVFLWFGIGAYILIFNREWLKSKWLYISIIITVIISLPILIWNFQNDFISFNFHTERVEMSGYSINFNYFLTEIFGEILYNNPVVYVLILLGLIAGFRGRLHMEKSHLRVILLSGLPIILTFIVFSLTRRTLPHWTAPGITTLIPLAAVYIEGKTKKGSVKIPGSILAAISIIIITIILGFAQINYGIFPIDNTKDYQRLGKKDPTLDMFGYRQAGNEFKRIVTRDMEDGTMSESSIMVGSKWFPLANFDFYAATPINMPVFGLGKLEDIHKYAWINNIEGGFMIGSDAYYLTDSREYKKPDATYYNYFTSVVPADTIQIYRGNKIEKRVFVYRLMNLKKLPEDVLAN